MYNKTSTHKNWSNYKKQRDICTNILKKTKTDWFRNIDVENITDTTIFWTTAKTFFADKSRICDRPQINLIIMQTSKS